MGVFKRLEQTKKTTMLSQGVHVRDRESSPTSAF